MTIVRPGATTDAHDNVVDDWSDSAVTRTDVDGCAWAPAQVAEDHSGGRQAVPVTGTLYLPASAWLLATDRVELRGETYEVDAEPGIWTHPVSGSTAGVEARLRRVTG